jgi:hypothetical protein
MDAGVTPLVLRARLAPWLGSKNLTKQVLWILILRLACNDEQRLGDLLFRLSGIISKPKLI